MHMTAAENKKKKKTKDSYRYARQSISDRCPHLSACDPARYPLPAGLCDKRLPLLSPRGHLRTGLAVPCRFFAGRVYQSIPEQDLFVRTEEFLYPVILWNIGQYCYDSPCRLSAFQKNLCGKKAADVYICVLL